MAKNMEFILRNNNPSKITFILEPWAEEFDVPAGSKLRIYIIYVKEGTIITDINQKYFVVWLWGGCRAQVLVDDQDLTPKSLSIPAIG